MILGGAVYDTIFTRSQLEAIAKLPSLPDSLAQTVALLNFNQQKLVSLLQSEQQSLLTNLSQRAKDMSKVTEN